MYQTPAIAGSPVLTVRRNVLTVRKNVLTHQRKRDILVDVAPGRPNTRRRQSGKLKGSEVRIDGVDKAFGEFPALIDVSLTVKKGEFFSLLGPSGCGKTTLLRIIAGFETPDVGSVLIDDVNILPIPPNRRHVNTVFQSYALFPHLSVFENIAFPLRLRGLGEKVVTQRVESYIELVRLHGQARKMPSQISGGQKQRVAIARALINEPDVLLLDEPLSALDAKLRQQLLIELDTIHDSVGVTFIYVTHDQQEALSVSDRVAVMNLGRVLQIGAPFEIYEQPADEFVANFIGDTNIQPAVVTSVEGELSRLDAEGLGPVVVTCDVPPEPGHTVRHTIRPEKIRISKKRPEGLAPNTNILQGLVDERIYSGFQSKFFVELPSGYVIKAFQQHARFLDDGPEIEWKDPVWVWWNANDGYVVTPRGGDE